MTIMIFKMEKDAINSNKGSVYFEMKYEPTNHYPEYLKRLMNEHPVTVEYKNKGYVGPDMVGSYSGNIYDSLLKTESDIVAWEPHKNSFPVQYWDAVNKNKELRKIIDMYDNNLIIKE
jgi:hypothetical protein